MRTIVTGSTSGLGRNMVEFLIEKKWEVIACGRNEEIGNQLNCTFKNFDLSNLESTIENFENVDYVFHCAALSSPWGKYKDFESSNIIATENVIKAMKFHNIKKLIHVSSPSIYFQFKDNINISEDFLPLRFVNNYASTKYLSEEIVKNSDVYSVIIRPRAIFGEYDNVLVPRLEKVLKTKGYIPIIKNKIVLSDVCYVGNVVHAMYLAAVTNTIDKSIFNITNDNIQPLKDLIEKLMLGIGEKPIFKEISYPLIKNIACVLEFIAKIGLTKEPVLTKYGLGSISFSQTLDISKAKKILGYKPIYSIEEGIERYAKWKNKTI